MQPHRLKSVVLCVGMEDAFRVKSELRFIQQTVPFVSPGGRSIKSDRILRTVTLDNYVWFPWKRRKGRVEVPIVSEVCTRNFNPFQYIIEDGPCVGKKIYNCCLIFQFLVFSFAVSISQLSLYLRQKAKGEVVA